MNPHCECPLSGYCQRHKIQKGLRSHQYCQGIGDKAWKYWEAWEQGLLGATAPEVPMLDRTQFGDGHEPDDLSTIGTALHDIFVRVTGKEIECEDCQRAVLRLNRMTAEQVEADREAIVADIKGRIPQQAPAIWKALAFVDDVLHLGQTEARLNSWLTEAIEAGKAVPPKKKRDGDDDQGHSQALLRVSHEDANHTRAGEANTTGRGYFTGHSPAPSGISHTTSGQRGGQIAGNGTSNNLQSGRGCSTVQSASG